MRSNRSAPVLLAGFGMLIGLIGVSGITAKHRARETYDKISSLNERYRKTDRNLNAVAAGIYTMGLLARDYLLDPASANGAEYRSQLAAERSAMEAEFRELKSVIRPEDKPRLEQLRAELDGYWDKLDPLFEWSAHGEGGSQLGIPAARDPASPPGRADDCTRSLETHGGKSRPRAAGDRPSRSRDEPLQHPHAHHHGVCGYRNCGSSGFPNHQTGEKCRPGSGTNGGRRAGVAAPFASTGTGTGGRTKVDLARTPRRSRANADGPTNGTEEPAGSSRLG